MNKKLKLFLLTLLVVGVLAACAVANSAEDDRVVLYSNADDEAVSALQKTLDEEGYEGQYVIQSMGTSELGGKLMAEGNKIEADIVTMASYFLESAQQKNEMFTSLTSELIALDDYGNYQLPILGNAGSLFINTKELEAHQLSAPISLKDLAKSEYEGHISFPNLFDSSTGWLLIQGVLATYGEEEGQEILAAIKKNAGPHIESSGSGPIKKVKTGEVAVGFGLRNQAVQAKNEGLPIEVIDPAEGNFTLTESISVIDKEGNELAIEMANMLAEKARAALLEEYPVVLYEGETLAEENEANFTRWDTTLTVELLEKHQKIFEEAK